MSAALGFLAAGWLGAFLELPRMLLLVAGSEAMNARTASWRAAKSLMPTSPLNAPGMSPA